MIRDRAEAVAMERAKRSMEISALNKKLEQTSLAAGGRTWEEDENDRRKREGLDPISARSNNRTNSVKEFGYLREVGTANYVNAVEDPEAKVVVHIYDQVHHEPLFSLFIGLESDICLSVLGAVLRSGCQSLKAGANVVSDKVYPRKGNFHWLCTEEDYRDGCSRSFIHKFGQTARRPGSVRRE